ncbi:MAG: hypothetical protein V4547_17600 [Bacteroidota bacterium]
MNLDNLTAEEMLLKPFNDGTDPKDITMNGETIIVLMENYGRQKWKQACKAQLKACEEKSYDLLYNDGDAGSWPKKIGKTAIAFYDDEPDLED